MDKSNKDIRRFHNILYAPDLPALYGQGLSDYEILVRLATVVNNNADIMNSWYTVAQELEKIIGDLDDEIKKQVIAKINEMYNSGELGEIIGQAIAQSMTGKTGDIDLQHIGYILHKAHSYAYSTLPDASFNPSIQEELFSALQGNCVFEIDGNLYWACAYVCQNGSTHENNDAIRLYVYTINQNGSLNYVTNREFAAVGHANGLGYLDGYIYITSNSKGGGYTIDVSRVSFDGENLGGTWSSTYNKYVVETRTPTGIEGDWTDYICGFDNQLYLVDSFMSLYTFDWATSTATKIIDRMNGLEGYTGDGMSVTAHYIYMGATGYRIKRYNRALGYIDWVYQLPVKPNNGAFKIGEVEGFTVLNGVLYLAGFYNLSGVSKAYCTYSVTHFYRQNLATNGYKIPALVNWTNGYIMEVGGVFVTEGALPSDTDNPKHVTTTEEYLHTNSVQMALDLIETNDYLQRGTISIRQRRNTETIDIRTTKPVNINGSYYRNNIESGVCPSIGHIYTASNTSIFIIDIIIDNRLPSDMGDTNAIDNCICSLGGCMSVQNCVFPTGLNTNAITVKYAIKAYRGLINARTDATYSTTPENWVTYRTQNGVENPSFIAGSDTVRNVNGTVTGN